MKNVKVKVVLRERELTVCDISIGPAEPDIGIMSSFIDDYSLKDEKGELIDLEKFQLTEAENDAICQKIREMEKTYKEVWGDE